MRRALPKEKEAWLGFLKNCGRMLLFLALASGTGLLFRRVGFPQTNIVVVYLLSVLLTARFTEGYWYGPAASVIATFAFNYFFTVPYHTFAVDDPSYLITFAIMTITSVITSALTTSAKQAASAQAEAQRQRYRANLLRSISHDLRTPLSGILGACEMLMDMSGGPEDPRYAIARGIYQDADWLHQLVENILGLTKVQEGNLDLNKQPEAVEEVVGEAVARVTRRRQSHNIEVETPQELTLVPMDARLIEQVLINLIGNAMKHTPPGLRICVTVTVEKPKGVCRFTVADEGEGISPEKLPHIFEPFYTSDAYNADGQRGLGLGLSICQAVVQAHGGAISAHNRINGPGAVFTFTLPLEES